MKRKRKRTMKPKRRTRMKKRPDHRIQLLSFDHGTNQDLSMLNVTRMKVKRLYKMILKAARRYNALKKSAPFLPVKTFDR